jgi:hypothetical protein
MSVTRSDPAQGSGHRAASTVAIELQERFTTLDGFAGVAYEPSDHSVIVYWRGVAPTIVSETIQAQVPNSRVQIRVQRAAFTQAELAEEGSRLASAFRTGFPVVATVSPRADNSGLDVQITPASRRRAEREDIDIGALLQSRYPVTVTGEAEILPA